MEGQRVGNIAFAGTQRASDCGRDRATHATRRRMLDQHDEWEGERYAGESIRAETAEEQAVKRDHAGDRQQVQDVRRGEPKQRGKDGRFEQQLCPPRHGAGDRLDRRSRWGCPKGTGDALVVHKWLLPQGDGAALGTAASSMVGRLRRGPTSLHVGEAEPDYSGAGLITTHHFSVPH
jgi:hypothetical protein